jgi:hypothetical protein
MAIDEAALGEFIGMFVTDLGQLVREPITATPRPSLAGPEP